MLLSGWSREEVYYIAERGYRLYREGRLREAAILFEGLIAIDPEDAYSRKALAAIGIRIGQYMHAVRHLTAILTRDRSDAAALAARCEALMAMKDLAAARRDLESLSVLAGGMEDSRRLSLQLRHQSQSEPSGDVSQLPAASLDNLYGW